MNTSDAVIFLDSPEAVSVDKPDFPRGTGNHFVVIPVAEVNMPVMNAIRYAKILSGKIVAVHILLNPSDGDRIEYRWKMQDIDIPLMVLESPEGSLIRPLKAYVDGIRSSHKESVVTIVLPVLVGLKWWQRVLHNQTARLIERAFEREAGVATIRVPFSLPDASCKGSCAL
ncbi:MAG: hypothetical protein ACHQ0Y_13505 [Thermodesulfovibrionales bacterium]